MCRDRHPEIFLEIWPDLAKFGVWKGRNLAVWIFSGPGKGWDPSGWICIDVRTPKTQLFPYLGHLGISSAQFSYYLGVPPGAPGMQVQYCTALLLDPHGFLGTHPKASQTTPTQLRAKPCLEYPLGVTLPESHRALSLG